MKADPEHDAEAARYALLRRLAPSFRHHLVVHLQPIGMIHEVMERRLRAPVPDLAHVQDSAGKINAFAKAALNSCIDVVSWLAPDDKSTVAVHEGARECASLLATSLGFRGFDLRNETTELPGLVSRSAMRNLVTGSLMHCTDQATGPAEVVLSASALEQGALVRLHLRPRQGEHGFRGEPPYRKLAWDDLQALGRADDVAVSREAGCIELRLPWMTPPAA